MDLLYLLLFFSIKIIQIKSADELLNACLKEAANNNIFIATAAVADFKPTIFHGEKIKKNNQDLTLKLTQNPDILANVKQKFPHLVAIGFAAETNNIKEYGRKKLVAKNLDIIAINDVSDCKVFGCDQTELHIITKEGKEYFIPKDDKEIVARKLLEII